MVSAKSPLIHNTLFDTYPVLIHAAGKPDHLPLWPSTLEAATQWRIDTRPDPTLTIITFNNGGTLNQQYKRLGLFEESLRRNGVEEMTILGGAIANWRHNLKINLLADYLHSGPVRDYVLVADSADVILANDIGLLVQRFKGFGCRALFNAERKHYPADLPPFDEQVAPGEYFPCLNSGVWIADTAFAKELAVYCAGLKVDKHGKCDQTRYKFAYQHFYPLLRVDHRCQLFQNLNRVDDKVVAVHRPEADAGRRSAWAFFARLAGR